MQVNGVVAVRISGCVSGSLGVLVMQVSGVEASGRLECIWRYNCDLETIGWKV